jgi:secreted PhoX family phosphatase
MEFLPMRPTYSPTRRKALQLFAGVPLMPIAAIGSSSALLTACGGGSSTAASPATAVSIKFNNMAAPTSTADRATTFTNATVDVTYSDATVKAAQPLTYNLIYKTGTTLPRPDGGTALTGGYYDISNNPIMDTTGSTTLQAFSDCPDGQSLLKLANPTVSGVTGNTVFLVTQFEYLSTNNAQGEARPGGGVYTNNLPAGLTTNSMYGKLPSQYGVTTLSQDKTTGALTAVYYYPVPTANVHGMWITCASSLSPWNTHLSSEEYEPDAWAVAITGDSGGYFRDFSRNTFGSDTVANPYHYGHVPEVTVHADGTGSVKKHFCMGRISREKVQVMPDNKTVLMGDDATSGGIFMFVAAVAGDLSSGTLYAAKLTQTSATGAVDGGAFTLTWIKLGQASSTEIEAIANGLAGQTGTQPGSLNAARGIITDVVATKPSTTSPAPSGYNLINFTSGASLYVKATSDLGTTITAEADLAGYTLVNYGNAQQFVKFAGALSTSNKAAAFLETHRFAAAMGATMEFTKFEGVTVNVKDKKAYFAMSAIKDTMTSNGFINDPLGGAATGNVIQVAKISAGGTYEVVLGTDATIGSDYVPKSMAVPTALLGQDWTPSTTPASNDAYGNSANVDKISLTDNLSYSEAMRTLFIGEDSSQHVNNYIWAYNVDTKALARIYSAPAGAECTGLQVVDNLNGFAYISANFQHAGDWEGIHGILLSAAGSTLNATINSNWGNKKQAAIGYISGLSKLA